MDTERNPYLGEYEVLSPRERNQKLKQLFHAIPKFDLTNIDTTDVDVSDFVPGLLPSEEREMWELGEALTGAIGEIARRDFGIEMEQDATRDIHIFREGLRRHKSEYRKVVLQRAGALYTLATVTEHFRANAPRNFGRFYQSGLGPSEEGPKRNAMIYPLVGISVGDDAGIFEKDSAREIENYALWMYKGFFGSIDAKGVAQWHNEFVEYYTPHIPRNDYTL